VGSVDHAQHQDGELGRRVVGARADRDLDLRQAIADRERSDELAQRHQQRRDRRRQHVAFAHVGDVARLALVEADQDAALLDHVADRQPRARPVAPRRPVHRRAAERRRHVADALERVLERALLGGDLELRRRVLQRAAAAGAEVRAARHDAVGRRALDARRARELPGRLALERLDHDALAGQPALDEDGLALDARDAAALGVERADVDGEQGHGVPRWRNRAFYRAPLE
jgi:hypothetical protein